MEPIISGTIVPTIAIIIPSITIIETAIPIERDSAGLFFFLKINLFSFFSVKPTIGFKRYAITKPQITGESALIILLK